MADGNDAPPSGNPDLSTLRGKVAAIAERRRFNPLNVFDWRKKAVDTWMQHNSRAAIEAWLDEDARTHTVEDGTTACGRYYHHLKNQTQASLANMWEPFRSMTTRALLTDAHMQEMLRSPDMAEQFRFVDAVIRERYPDEHGDLYKPQYNHQFLTEDSAGTIVAMGDDAIVKLFQQRGEGEHLFPHIIMTSSHARGETLEDVTSITHGIEAMARDSEGRKMPHAFVDTGVAPGQTLTLYACDVEKSPMLNAAKLIDRVNELKRIAKTGEVEDSFMEISPGAARIAKLMLKCMVENPEAIDTQDGRRMGDIAATSQKPIRLRADAVEIAHHFQLIGYSKGGNVVSDAMRYLVSELTAKNARGKDVFETHPDSPVVNGDGTAMTPRNVSKIVRNIAVMALASVEVGMSEYYKDHGVRRVAINSDKDLISAHRNYESSVYDERWIIHGVEQNVGHAPQDMMGTRAEIKGFAHDDPRVARRLKEFFAPNYGKAAIGRLVFNGHAAEGEVTIEAATGTSDSQIEPFLPTICETVARALKKRPSDVQCISDTSLPGIFTLKCKGVDFTKSTNALEGLDTAFQELRSKHLKGLVVTQTILEPEGDIDQQITKVSGLGRG